MLARAEVFMAAVVIVSTRLFNIFYSLLRLGLEIFGITSNGNL
jgi:hypothetical protein